MAVGDTRDDYEEEFFFHNYRHQLRDLPKIEGCDILGTMGFCIGRIPLQMFTGERVRRAMSASSTRRRESDWT